MVSTIAGPIPPHPYYDTSDSNSYVRVVHPRVRPEAEDIAKQGHGTICLALEIEGHKMPSAYKRSNTESKDHLKENVRRLREIQRSARKKSDIETSQPVKALWKLQQFEGVGSKVKEELEKTTLAPRPQTATFLRAHSRTGFLPHSARAASVEPPDDKLTVPKASTARDVQLIRRDIDFVRVNSLAAKNSLAIQRSPSVSALDDLRKQVEEEDKNYKRGEIPKYLLDRKKQWDKEDRERRACRTDPDMPPGHRLMLDDERRQTLERIKQKQMELMSEISAMPICNDTLRVRKKREELELKLTKVEEAVKIFSRQKVFVKLDS